MNKEYYKSDINKVFNKEVREKNKILILKNK